MSWMIVSDTSCEIRSLAHPAPGVQFALAPFKIRIGEREYVDLRAKRQLENEQVVTNFDTE